MNRTELKLVSRLWALGLLSAAVPLAAEPGPAEDIFFRGVANASAAVAIGANQVLVADDDDNRLRLYEVSGGDPKSIFDWSHVLRSAGRHPEADIEAAARLGDRIYWLGSHSRAKDGDARPNRHRFFATGVTHSTNGPALVAVGEPCLTLLDGLLRTPQARALGFTEAAALISRRLPLGFPPGSNGSSGFPRVSLLAIHEGGGFRKEIRRDLRSN